MAITTFPIMTPRARTVSPVDALWADLTEKLNGGPDGINDDPHKRRR
jgi:hypothetical protein